MRKKTASTDPSTRPQMSDIARLAGVSESTVSRALSDHPGVAARTRAYVKELAASAGYRVDPIARSLRSRRSQIISVVIPLIHDREQHLSDPFMMTMLALLADELADRGYSMLLSKLARQEDDWVQRLLADSRADGVIVLGQSLVHASMDRAARAGLPLVVWGTQLPQQAYASVGSDNRRGGELATGHLIEVGRRRIAFIGDERLPEIEARYQGYRHALEKHGLAYDQRLHVRSHFFAEDAYRSVQAMLKKSEAPDGVVAASDVIAVSAIRALSDNRLRVPQDVSVVGFDDIPLAAYSQPPLTTIRQDFAQAARMLVERILAVVAGEAVASYELPVLLVVRESA